MTITGCETFIKRFPDSLRRKRVGILCHSASVLPDYTHITEAVAALGKCRLEAIFGPQHGIYGQTQDNMIEWEGSVHPNLGIPVYSLYGKTRKPTPAMLTDLDVLVIDIQDVGARPYTYVWTMKLCMEACVEAGISISVLDRPNPVSITGFDGPMIDPELFSFVGGAPIPLCHRMTVGEIALLIKELYFPSVDLSVVRMENWHRNMSWADTGLPWVIPSPNMPTVDTAVVYPGMVLLEATNLSEGRGTTRPFEMFGAPYINAKRFMDVVSSFKIPGCVFRKHDFLPTFQKWAGEYCHGFQIHVTDPCVFKPVRTAVMVLHAALEASDGAFAFKPPPYEYEHEKQPFDILYGDSRMRKCLHDKQNVFELCGQWEEDRREFLKLFNTLCLYPEF